MEEKQITESKMLLGDKNIFAIEIGKDEKSKFDKFCIYLGNEKLGYYDDVVYLSYLKSAIDCLLKQDLVIAEFATLSNEDIFNQIFYNKEVDYWKCVFSVGENFDDFMICAYRLGNNMVFLWRFAEKPFFTYKDFDQKLHECKLNNDYFIRVYLQFLEFYKLADYTE